MLDRPRYLVRAPEAFTPPAVKVLSHKTPVVRRTPSRPSRYGIPRPGHRALLAHHLQVPGVREKRPRCPQARSVKHGLPTKAIVQACLPRLGVRRTVGTSQTRRNQSASTVGMRGKYGGGNVHPFSSAKRPRAWANVILALRAR